MDQKGRLIQDICSALIDNTPEHWFSAHLYLRKTQSGLEHRIESAEGYDDLVTPDAELFSAPREFELFLNSTSEMFKTAKFSIWLDDSDKWNFKSEFEY